MINSTLDLSTETGAIVSSDQLYRYALWRRWTDGPAALFLCLNPSTADATLADPTLRRCQSFARTWGYGCLLLGNLYAYRTPYPKELRHVADPIGPETDAWLACLVNGASLIVAAWGTLETAGQRARARKVLTLMSKPIVCLGVTAGGYPRHPLYLRKDVTPQSFMGAEP